MLPQYIPIINKYKENYDKDLEILKVAIAEGQGNYSVLEAYLRNSTNRVFYGEGSDMLRGYFGPSLIKDIVVSGVHRGEFYKDTRNLKKVETYYYFNREKKLIGARLGQLGRMEFICYKGNNSYGFCYGLDKQELRYVTKCEYDGQGRLASYVLSDCETAADDMGKEYTKEIYLYEQEELAAALVYHTPRSYEPFAIRLKQFKNLVNEAESKEAWWREPKIYEFAYNAAGRAVMYYSVDLETDEREDYEIPLDTARSMERTIRNLRCPCELQIRK